MPLEFVVEEQSNLHPPQHVMVKTPVEEEHEQPPPTPPVDPPPVTGGPTMPPRFMAGPKGPFGPINPRRLLPRNPLNPLKRCCGLEDRRELKSNPPRSKFGMPSWL